MNIVLTIPTGIGCEIGGYAGDGNVVAKLFAGICDNLITHPNVVNASDINEMTENTLYVEGSAIDRLLIGEIGLKKVKSNKILLIVNKDLKTDTINSASAARVTIGVDIKILELEEPIIANVYNVKNNYDVEIEGLEKTVLLLTKYQKEFDALAIQTPINVSKDIAYNYLDNGGINPWGFAEAKISGYIGSLINKPVAHSPLDTGLFDDYVKVSDPRMAAEFVSVSYLHCILKGLHKAPAIKEDMSEADITFKNLDVFIYPVNCNGLAQEGALKNNIPMIAVRNDNCLEDNTPPESIIANNYFEAAGIAIALRDGISLESFKRPIEKTKIIN